MSSAVILLEPRERAYMNGPILENLAANGLIADHFGSIDEMDRAGASLEQVEVLITNACPRSVMDRAPHLKAIINPYTGSELIDIGAATERGIPIGIGQTVENYTGMAEATIFLMLACHYNLAQSEEVLRAGLPRPPITARLLKGSVVGVVGYGLIGQAVVKRLKDWDVELLVTAPRLHAPLPEGARHVEIDELLTESDVVLVLCTLNSETRNLLSRERLATMKPSAALVNTARGGIVDEAAVADMLKQGRLRRAALDAFAVEPLPDDSPLRTAPNAILTPHMIGHNINATQAMARTASESVWRVLAGEPPCNVLNSQVLAAWPHRKDAHA